MCSAIRSMGGRLVVLVVASMLLSIGSGCVVEGDAEVVTGGGTGRSDDRTGDPGPQTDDADNVANANDNGNGNSNRNGQDRDDSGDSGGSPAPGAPGGQSGGGTPDDGGSADSSPAPAPDPGSEPDVAALINAVRDQLADRFIETGSSSGSGSDALTGILQLGLCRFGLARAIEQTIFSGGTPTDFIDFSSDTTIDGVWDVVVFENALALEIRDRAPAGSPPGQVLRRFRIDLDNSGSVVAINGGALRTFNDLSADCSAAQQNEQQLDAAEAALVNRRALLTAGTEQAELALCGTGNYGFLATENGSLAIREGGTWTIEPGDAGLTVVLRSDPSFDPNGETFTTRLTIEFLADGSVRLAQAETTLTPIGGSCDQAILDLLQ